MTQLQTAYARPLPIMVGLTKEFYDWCKQGELRFQRCSDCGTWRHIPWPMCPECNSMNWSWAKSTGRGTVQTWTVVHQAFNSTFADDVPYAAVIVKMDEGPGLISWLTDVAPEHLRIGMEVEVWFDPVTPEVTLPRFKSAR